MKIRYYGPFAKPTGYARACHDYLMAIVRTLGDTDELQITPISEADDKELEPRYEELLAFVPDPDDLHPELFEPDVVIVHTVPTFAHEFVTGDLAPGPNVLRIAITTWETNKLPTDIAKTLNEHFDAVIVPSHFNQRVFDRAGVVTCVVPHVFDSKFWWRNDPPACTEDPYVFYSIGVWSERKNPIGLLKAFWTEFRADEPVLLRVLSPMGQSQFDDAMHLAHCLGIPALPKVEFISERLSESEVRRLHYVSDCYVSTSRGEGFGLGAFEALGIGNPVIVTGFSGWCDFEEYGDLVLTSYSLTPAVTPEVKSNTSITIGNVKLAGLTKNAPIGISGDQSWAEPDLTEFKESMRFAFEKRKRRLAPRSRSQLRLATDFSYDVVGMMFMNVIKVARRQREEARRRREGAASNE